jgi:hypothetical protein
MKQERETRFSGVRDKTRAEQKVRVKWLHEDPCLDSDSGSTAPANHRLLTGPGGPHSSEGCSHQRIGSLRR